VVHRGYKRQYQTGELASDELPIGTSDIETSELEEHSHAIILTEDFKLETKVQVRLNGKLIHSENVNNLTCRTLDMSDIELMMQKSLDREASGCGYALRSLKASYKLNNGPDRYQERYLKTFDASECDEMMKELNKHRQKLKRASAMLLIFVGSYDLLDSKKRKQQEAALSSSPPTAKQQRTALNITSSPPTRLDKQDTFRTKSSKATVVNRKDQYEDRAKNQQLLADTSRCQDKHCPNHPNLCWIDSIKHQHFAMSVAQLENWARHIEKGEATLTNPPIVMVQYWLQKQHPVGSAEAKAERVTLSSVSKQQEAMGARQNEIEEMRSEFEMRQAKLDLQRQQNEQLALQDAIERRRQEADDRRTLAEEKRDERDERRREMEDDRRERREEQREMREQQRRQRELMMNRLSPYRQLPAARSK
jgi:hypothetical protein